MEVTIHEQDGVIILRFTGEVCFADMIESWEKMLLTYENLQDYKGVLTSFLEADIKDEHTKLNVMVEYLINYADRLKNLRIAVVETPPCYQYHYCQPESEILADQALFHHGGRHELDHGLGFRTPRLTAFICSFMLQDAAWPH